MPGKKRILAALGVLLAIGILPSRADDANEARLREALRGTTVQLRDAQDEVATLQAKLAAAQQENARLKVQAAPETAPTPASSAAAYARAASVFNRQLAGQNQTLARLQAAYNAAADAAKAAEVARTQLAAEFDAAKNRATTCEAKNQKLYDTAREILDHFAHEDFGDALMAHEPFVGFKRVELENLMQDDQDKLRDNKVKP